MHGVYAWNAGATAAQIRADLVAMISGAAIADLSASCDKAASSTAGAASGWVAMDAPYGVLSAAGEAGGPGRQVRLSETAAPRVIVGVVAGWNGATHAAASASSAMECTATIDGAGLCHVLATPDGLLLASSDWSVWGMVAEVKRDGPALAGMAALSGALVVNQNGYAFMARAKKQTGYGYTDNQQVSVASVFGALAATPGRDAAETLYMPMVPAVVSNGGVPVGELVGLRAVGGYAQSGDTLSDGAGDVWQLVKAGNLALALKRA